MKNIYAFNPDIFYKLVYGMIYGAISDPNSGIQFADHRVDMFFFSLQKYILKFQNDILNTDLSDLLFEHKSDWFELWENPDLFFELSDNIYDSYILYERIHGCGYWFDEFDKYGNDFIQDNLQVIINAIMNYIEKMKHAGYYELMPVNFNPDKNINFLLPYLQQEWKPFIDSKKAALLESANVCKRMEFHETDFDTAYQWMSDNDSELWHYMTDYLNNDKDKYEKVHGLFIDDQNSRMHFIILDGKTIGLIGFNSVYESFYNEEIDELRSYGIFGIDDFRNGIGKKSLWVSFLEIKYYHSIENITSVMQKLCEYAKSHGYINMLCGAKDQKVKKMYMRAGWTPVSDDYEGLVLTYML